jgi:hypothetical protein
MYVHNQAYYFFASIVFSFFSGIIDMYSIFDRFIRVPIYVNYFYLTNNSMLILIGLFVIPMLIGIYMIRNRNKHETPKSYLVYYYVFVAISFGFTTICTLLFYSLNIYLNFISFAILFLNLYMIYLLIRSEKLADNMVTIFQNSQTQMYKENKKSSYQKLTSLLKTQAEPIDKISFQRLEEVLHLKKVEIIELIIDNSENLTDILVDCEGVKSQYHETLDKFIDLLDQQFNKWESQEKTKTGKKVN